MSECDCKPTSHRIPIGAKRMPTDRAWRWTCRHGHEFIRMDPRWERVYTLDELKERIKRGTGQ